MTDETLRTVVRLFDELQPLGASSWDTLAGPAPDAAASMEIGDSLIHVTLAHAIEQHFGVVLPDDVLVPTPGQTLGGMASATDRAISARRS